MQKYLLLTLISYFALPSFGQDLSDTLNVEYSKNSPKRLSFGLGLPFCTFAWVFKPNLNKLLASKNIDSWNAIETLPLTLNYQKDRFKLSGDVVFSLPDSPHESQGQFATTLSGMIFNLNLGYAFLSERNYFIYFNLGTALSQFTKNIEIKNSQTTSLTSALQSGVGNSFILRNTGAFLDVNLEIMNRTAKAKSIGKSLKVGYRHGIKETRWRTTFNSFSESPLDRMSNIYSQLTITIPNIRRWSIFNSNNEEK